MIVAPAQLGRGDRRIFTHLVFAGNGGGLQPLRPLHDFYLEIVHRTAEKENLTDPLRSAQPAGDGWHSNIQLTLLPGGGETLALEVSPREPLGVFPPMLQLSDDPTAQADTMAYANLYAIPAGAKLY